MPGRIVIWIGKSGIGVNLWKAGAATLAAVGSVLGIGYWFGKKKK